MDLARNSVSPLWKHISETHITKERIRTLKGFKSSDVNFKISLWNPRVNGVRYLKALIYNLAASFSPHQVHLLTAIKNRNVGDPITVIYEKHRVCLDYLQAVLELSFIENHIDMNGRTIMEIGAGYGRTCHAILSNYQVKSYTIVDLENCLQLSRRYLRTVLSKDYYSRIVFVRADDFDALDDPLFDVCINIDSFAEMDANVAKHYLRFVSQRCKFFYVKNPVGKYLDKSLDNHSEGSGVVKLALSTGLLTKVIDIHDNRSVTKAARNFVKIYRPSESWECVGDGWAPPWSYYWQAFYHKKY
jgi:putative sugar O-methyltransferase